MNNIEHFQHQLYKIGDSGGPLMGIDDSHQQVPFDYHYVIGIVSFGLSCGEEGIPGVYTRVDMYINWILSHMRR